MNKYRLVPCGVVQTHDRFQAGPVMVSRWQKGPYELDRYPSRRGLYGIYRTHTATGTVLAGRPAVSPVPYPTVSCDTSGSTKFGLRNQACQ